MRITLVLLVIFALSLSFVAGRAEAAEAGSWRYKMTVKVETPEGIKTGSAVREVSVKRLSGAINPATVGVRLTVSGEAVAVDLGKRGILFALMRNDYGPDYAFQVVFDAFPSGAGITAAGINYYSHLKHVHALLNVDQYPMMVAFRDLKDPKTVEPVLITEPYDLKGPGGLETHHRIKIDNLEKIFGQGVKLKEIEIEMTDESVTHTINQILPWILERARNQVRGYVGGSSESPFTDPTNTYLSGTDFMVGSIN